VTLSRLHITTLLGLAVVAWFLVLLVQGTPVGKEHLAPFSSVVAVLVLLGVLFEHVLWHQRAFHGWFVPRPDLRGTWRVELQSDWVDPRTGARVGPIQGFVAVTQTLSHLQMHLMTPESQSWFVADRITPSPKNAGYRVAAVYTNEPDPLLRGKRSEIHYGALVLDTHGASRARPDGLSGEYWTDRATKGTMTLSGRARSAYSRFEEAREAFSAKPDAGMKRSGR
jgi:hypothetical protein